MVLIWLSKKTLKIISFFKLTNEVVDLLKNLLEKNPVKRYSIYEALEHKWFKNYTFIDDNNGQTNEVVNNLKRTMIKM